MKDALAVLICTLALLGLWHIWQIARPAPPRTVTTEGGTTLEELDVAPAQVERFRRTEPDGSVSIVEFCYVYTHNGALDHVRTYETPLGPPPRRGPPDTIGSRE